MDFEKREGKGDGDWLVLMFWMGWEEEGFED